MSIQFVDLLTVKACQEKAEQSIRYARTVARAYALVRPLFVKHNGRKMTKRMETDFVKALDQEQIPHEHMWCRYSTEYGMYHFKIGGTFLGEDFNSWISFNVHLGYASNGNVMDVAWVDEHNVYYSQNALTEAAKHEAELKLIPGLVQQWNNALAALQVIHKRAEAVGLQYTFDISNK